MMNKNGFYPTTGNINIPHGLTPIQEKVLLDRSAARRVVEKTALEAVSEGDSLRRKLKRMEAAGKRIIEIPLPNTYDSELEELIQRIQND